MNPAHVHLLLNHAPVMGAYVTLLLWIYALLRHSDELRRVAMLGMVLVALLAVPTFLTGEPAEKRVEHAPGVSEEVIKPHEDSAKFALGGAILLGLLGLAGLVAWRGSPAPRWFGIAVLLVNLTLAVIVARTANLGGEIRHTEIRAGAGQTPVAGSGEGEKTPEQGENERDEKSEGH